MSGLFGSTTIPGNRLTDIAAQTSTVGIPLPFGYGKFPVDGNIIWSAGVPTEHVKKKTQGKGGVKTQEFSYTLSYAIAFCAGPIYDYLTIIRQGKVVFTTDPNAAIEDKEFAEKWAQKCTMYFGTRTQLPDSTIEAKEGVGKVSAFRDLAYIVLEDDDVTDNGGGVPQYSAVIVGRGPSRVTTQPYALESESSFSSALTNVFATNDQTVGLMGDFSSSFGDLRVDVQDLTTLWSSDVGTFGSDILGISGTVQDLRILRSAQVGAFTSAYSVESAEVVTIRVVLDKVQGSGFNSSMSIDAVEVAT